MKHFKGAMREQGLLLPYDLSEWLPEDHLARFVVDIVDKLDIKDVYTKYQGKGSAAYDPRLLLALLFYGYSTGIFSSRKLEAATYDSVAFRFIASNHPDHDTIATFRKRFLGEIQDWFKSILLIGKELDLVKMGNIYIDGTKTQANASPAKAMSYEYMKRLEEQLESEIKELLSMAATQDEKENGPQLVIPEELKRREDRLEKIKQAQKVVESRGKDRFKGIEKEYKQTVSRKKKKEKQTGKKQGARVPKAPDPATATRGTDQYNFTDPESRIMKTSKGFNQCYNAQPAVNEDIIIVGAYSNNHGSDANEFIPVIKSVVSGLGKITAAVADTGYFSETNVLKAKKGIEPIISVARESHNGFLKNFFSKKEQILPDDSVKQKMRKRLDSPQGSAIYKKRKQIVEPVFGIIKEVLGFRRFSLRGEKKTNGEWTLVCLAYNIKRLFKLKQLKNIAIQG